MYFKIAKNNVKRSIKDYTIYFLTLTFAICIFYSFNSIESQKLVLSLNESQGHSIDLLNDFMKKISLFISVILGGLIIYANNFLVKKRKKELGVYMTLGMAKRKISKILFLETFLIGLISLIIGLAFGIIASQGLSIATAKLFDISISKYKFLISTQSILKTCIYFGSIFILVICFNTIVISRYKLIDMLNASKKSEKIRVKNPIISIIIFIISLIVIGFGYYYINKWDPTNLMDKRFARAIILGCVGTFMFFFSFATFILEVIKRTKSIYFKKLNIFIVRQINSKVNTNFISVSIICLMLFVTICTLSTGLGFKKMMEVNFENGNPYNASVSLINLRDERLKPNIVREFINKEKFEFNNKEKYAYFDEYRLKFELWDILKKYSKDKEKRQYGLIENRWHRINAIKISDYNKLQTINNEETVNLEDNEVLIMSNVKAVEDLIQNFIDNKSKIKINNIQYTIKNKNLIKKEIKNSGYQGQEFLVILPDKALNNQYVSRSNICINYDDKNKEISEKKMTNLFKKINGPKGDYYIWGESKIENYERTKSGSTLIVYIIAYIGSIFLIATAAILALQQLSEASDSKERYKSLRRIGVTNKMINKSIFTQILIYFMLPLGLAIVHSVMGIYIANKFMELFMRVNLLKPTIITMMVLVFIYSVYFIVTYVGCKNIVNEK